MDFSHIASHFFLLSSSLIHEFLWQNLFKGYYSYIYTHSERAKKAFNMNLMEILHFLTYFWADNSYTESLKKAITGKKGDFLHVKNEKKASTFQSNL